MPGLPVRVYECSVTGVGENNRVLSAKSRKGRQFTDVSYLLPWISANGSGIDLIPKTGDSCLILATPQPVKTRSSAPGPRAGGNGFAMCIGFKVPPQAVGGIELGGRLPGLPQGSIGIQCKSEGGAVGQLILTRGGTTLIAADSDCRTLYSSVDSSIIHIFNNWKVIGPGGHVRWTREQGKEDVHYHAQYRTKTEGAEFTVDVAIDNGGGEQSLDPVSITVHRDGGNPYLQVRVDTNGEAHIEGESINIFGRAGVSIDGAQVKIKNRQVLGQGDPI